jgi:hypothetical protein
MSNKNQPLLRYISISTARNKYPNLLHFVNPASCLGRHEDASEVRARMAQNSEETAQALGVENGAKTTKRQARTELVSTSCPTKPRHPSNWISILELPPSIPSRALVPFNTTDPRASHREVYTAIMDSTAAAATSPEGQTDKPVVVVCVGMAGSHPRLSSTLCPADLCL